MKFISVLLKVYYKLPFRPFRKQFAWMFNQYRKLDRDKKVIVTRKGVNFELNLRDRVQSGIYYDFYEPVITRLFEKSLKRGGVLIDVGANIGYYSLLSVKLVGKEGKVYAFEPMSLAYNRFKKNLSLNNFTNIVLEKKGVSDKNEKLRVYFQNEYIVPSMRKKEEGTILENIELTTIDNYVKANKINKVSLIKVDTDGYDFKVLKGAMETIKKFKPLITIEVDPKEEDHEMYLDFLFKIPQYKVYSDVGGKSKRYSKEEIASISKKRGIINLILFPIK